MDDINKRLDIIENKLDNILFILQNDVVNDCKRMSNHITFIDRVYESVKHPLYYVCSKFNPDVKQINK